MSECKCCGRWFKPGDEESELCPICEMDDALQREMERDVE